MVFDHIVKHNGVLYKTGEDVPMEQETEKPAPVASPKADDTPKETKRRGRKPAKSKEQ